MTSNDGGGPVSAGGPSRLPTIRLAPEIRPPWLAPLVDNVDRVPHAYRRKVPPE